MAQATAMESRQLADSPAIDAGTMNKRLAEFAHRTGFEDRSEELGKSVAVVIKTLSNNEPYPHEINDAVVKMHLTAVQFAKNRGLLKEFVEHDRQTMAPVNKRMKTIIEKSGMKEIALIALTERTGCHYQLVLETKIEPGKRSWVSPFRRVLEVSRKIGQFDLTEREIHEQWVKPRFLGYAQDMGVNLRVSDWNDDGVVSIELID
jgi:hypothetical protein